MSTTILQKWGNSQGIRIPKTIIDSMNWNINEKLSIRTESDTIIIERASKRKNIMELFADYNDNYICENIDWGKTKGKEIW